MFSKYLALLIFLAAGCAEERSPEDRERAEVEREVKRLQLAEARFLGAAKSPDADSFIPVKFNTRTLRNPDGDSDNPVIEAELRIGLFGGVSFRTTQTSYDFGSKKLVARFADKAGTAEADDRSIEWHSLVNDGVISQAKILTSIGEFDLSENTEFGDAFATSTDKTYSFALRTSENDSQFSAKLTLENLAEDEAAPQGYTVPRIPKLRSSIRFSGTGIVPQNADRTLYDPLRSRIEIFYPGNARLMIDQLTVSAPGLSLSEDLATRSLSGSLFRGAEKQSSITLTSLETPSLTNVVNLDLPPEKYVGTYQTSRDGFTWEAAVKLEYVGDIGINNENLTFRLFPQMKLTLFRCMSGGQWLSRKYYSLKSIDYIRSKARFTLINAASSGEYDLILSFTAGWTTLNGYYVDGESGGLTGEDFSEFQLTADSEGFEKSCTE